MNLTNSWYIYNAGFLGGFDSDVKSLDDWTKLTDETWQSFIPPGAGLSEEEEVPTKQYIALLKAN